MFTNLQNQATYFGTIDDVVHRYPWDSPVDLHTIRQQLITSAIYDKKLLINDGYLVANPTILAELTNPRTSLIGAMLMSDQAWLFTRGGANIAEGIEAQAAKVNTHSALVRSASWQETRNKLGTLDKYAAQFAVRWPRDKNLGLAFYLLMREVHDSVAAREDADAAAELSPYFRRVFARFDADLDKSRYLGARSIWEQAAWAEVAQTEVDPLRLMEAAPADREALFPGYDQVRRLMAIANQVYHYAYASAAGHALKNLEGRDVPSQIGVASGFSFVHPGMTSIEAAPVPLQHERDNALLRLSISLPSDIRFKDDFSRIADLDTDTDCRLARAHYLEELRNVWNGSSDLGPAGKARDEYRTRLARLLAPMVEDKVVEFAGKALFTPITFALGKVVPFVGGLIGFVIGIDRMQKKMVERLMTKRIEAALDENAIHAIQSGKPIPALNRGDLYFGPLRAEGVETLMDQVDAPKP